MSPILAAYHGIGRADPHIPTKFTNSRNVISAYYAPLANLEFACFCLKTYPIWEGLVRDVPVRIFGGAPRPIAITILRKHER